jgi:hypothetical protein
MAFRRRLILRIAAASHSRSSAYDRPPACAMSCLTPREVSIGIGLLGRRLASAIPGAASRLATTSSNTRFPPLIRPYLPREQTLLEFMPHPLEVGLYSVVCDREKTYRTARAGDLGAGIAQNVFSKARCRRLSRQLLILRIAMSALLAPYRARHGTATGFLAPTTGR